MMHVLQTTFIPGMRGRSCTASSGRPRLPKGAVSLIHDKLRIENASSHTLNTDRLCNTDPKNRCNSHRVPGDL